MKKIAVAAICILLAGKAWALDLNGYLKTDWRVRIDGSGGIDYNENDLGLKIKSALAGAGVFAELELKNIGFSSASTLNDLSLYDKTRVAPWTFELKEAYVDLTGLFVKNLDVRAGKQRITWGTADRFNPTDNLNPLDLSDLTDFGKRLGTNSIKATCYIGDCYIQGIYLPVFTPAVLPANWQSMYPLPAMPGMAIRNLDITAILPDNTLDSSSFAVKVGGKIFGFDASLSYFRGYDGLPLNKNMVVTMVDTVPTVDVAVEVSYPRMQVVGVDLAGSIGDVGVWAEMGYFIPDQFDTGAIFFGAPQLPGTKLKDPYFKYTVGADYTFPFIGIYANVQYCHGFFDEMDTNLKDYLVANIDKKFFNDKLKIALAGFMEMDLAGGEHFIKGLTIYPEITYVPFDATEILLGAYIIDSREGGKFYSSKDSDEIFLKVKYSF